MTDLYLQSDGRDMTVWHDDKPLLTEHQAGPVLWAHLVATLPTRDEPQPEPLDPGVRVRDVDGDEWARCSDDEVWSWTSPGHDGISWTELRHARGPLTIITPAPEPTPDERPFKVGDRVLIAEHARTDDPEYDGGMSVVFEGREGTYQEVSGLNGSAVVRVNGVSGYRVGHSYLTHADADAPC